MKKRLTSPADIQMLGTILSVWAHPDDETYSCAGIMAMAIENGQEVICVTATRGEAGVQDESRWSAERLGEIRAAELADALRAIGVTQHHWLGYRDGECAVADEIEAVSKVLDLIRRYQPDTILTFGPDGLTGHTDHSSVSRWVDKAVARSGQRIRIYHVIETVEKYDKYFRELDEKFDIYFNLDKPYLVPSADCDMCVCLTDDAREKKYQALCCMPSQTEGIIRELGRKKFNEAFEEETFVRAA